MQDQVYELEYIIEQDHWWFVGRRNLFKSYIKKMPLDKKMSPILDVGSSSGTNLRLLKDLGFKNYKGFDYNQLSQKFCKDKGLGNVIIGDICSSNLTSNSFELILVTDVIEHIENDSLALKEIHRILKPGGKVIITVPSFMCLWSDSDVTAMHKRRYLIKELRQKVKESGLKIDESYYFNFLLFIPILLFRKLTKLLNIKVESENLVNSKLINVIFKIIFTMDIFLSKKIKTPIGVSSFLLATK